MIEFSVQNGIPEWIRMLGFFRFLGLLALSGPKGVDSGLKDLQSGLHKLQICTPRHPKVGIWFDTKLRHTFQSGCTHRTPGIPRIFNIGPRTPIGPGRDLHINNDRQSNKHTWNWFVPYMSVYLTPNIPPRRPICYQAAIPRSQRVMAQGAPMLQHQRN